LTEFPQKLKKLTKRNKKQKIQLSRTKDEENFSKEIRKEENFSKSGIFLLLQIEYSKFNEIFSIEKTLEKILNGCFARLTKNIR